MAVAPSIKRAWDLLAACGKAGMHPKPSLHKVNELAWLLKQLPGVDATNSMAALAKFISVGYNEGNFKWLERIPNQAARASMPPPTSWWRKPTAPWCCVSMLNFHRFAQQFTRPSMRTSRIDRLGVIQSNLLSPGAAQKQDRRKP